MSLVSLLWANASASDIHLLPGLVSPELKLLLLAGDLDPATGEVTAKQLSKMTGLSVAFSAQLAGGPAGHGLTMSTTTGEITVDSDAMKGRSFIVTATGTQGTVTVTTRIRVYVHGSIDRMWLTPRVLTVRKGAKNMRFSVLARFDDGVIADISHWSPFEKPGSVSGHTYVRPKNSDDRVLTWAAELVTGASAVTADPDTGELSATGDSGISKVTVRRQDGEQASASAVCAESWSTPVRLTHLSGPGIKSANFVPNILFLPDGFQKEDKEAYERLVRLIVARLSTRNRTRPFQAFTGRINYFMAWVPSPDAGVSILNEAYRDTEEKDQANERRAIDYPSATRRAPDRWKLEDLINAVGLPTPKGDPDGSALDDARVTTWRNLYGPDVTKTRVQPLFARWLDRNDRMLSNERDTAFHMAFGSRPALDGSLDRGLAFNPRRLHDDDFNTFLDALQGPKGQAIGTPIWSTGKDKNLIVVLCRSMAHGGQNDGHTIGISLGSNSVHKVKAAPDGNGFDLDPDPIPVDASFVIWLRTAHELGHSWTLGDEYGESPQLRQDLIAGALGYANIQARSTLLDSADDLSFDKLKWGQWPRIAKAGVLLTNPAPLAGGKFTLTLDDGKAAGFKPGDVVRLRTRPLHLAAAPSARCKVESVADDQVIIAPVTAAGLDPAKFPPGSIVMAPVRGKDPNPAANKYGDDLTLIDADMLIQRVFLTQNPLNAQPGPFEGKPPNDNVDRPCANVKLKVPTPATNFIDRKAPNPPKFSSWNIGIYENGGRSFCGIYRPTGICIMTEQWNRDPKTNEITLYDFCLICRYALVDAVDPTRYGAVEDDYRERYGARGAGS